MTQNERLLDHLKNNHSVQPLEALQDLGIYRLAARIHDLKQNGHWIEKKIVEVSNRYGEVFRVAQYFLIKAA
jgi:hypothetical protein